MTYKEALEDMCMDCVSYPCKALKSEDHCYSYNILVDALEKAEKYKWHDLRKDSNDLPSEDGWVHCWLRVKDIINYDMDLYFYSGKNIFIDNRRKNVFEMYDVMAFSPTGVNMRKQIYTDDLCNRTSDVIAWQYSEHFEEDQI